MQSAFLKHFIDSRNAASMAAAVERTVDEFIPRGHIEGHRVRLERIAAALGVTSIRVMDLPCEGMLVPLNDESYEVLLSSRTGWRRRRFSLAHELGHILLHKLFPETRRLETRTIFTPPGGTGEERICNQLAAAILMPREQLAADMDKLPRVTTSAFAGLAQKYAVSLTAIAVRFNELRPNHQIALVRFEAASDGQSTYLKNCIVDFAGQGIRHFESTRFGYKELPTQAFHASVSPQGWLSLSSSKLTRRRLYADIQSPRQDGRFALGILMRSPN